VHDLQDAEIERDLRSGRLKSRLVGNPENIALCLYSVEGKEFFIAALKSLKTNGEIDLSDVANDELTKLAKSYGCEYIRFHTFRPGLVAKAIDRGFLPTEFILRKKL
jgi:hypothetical protein